MGDFLDCQKCGQKTRQKDVSLIVLCEACQTVRSTITVPFPLHSSPLCAPVLLQLFDRHGPVGQPFRDPAKLEEHLATSERRGLHVGRYMLVEEREA